MIRQFLLLNGEGASYDLNRKCSFFHSIRGFGFTDTTQFEQIGTDFYPLEEMFSQGELEGSILFAGANAYDGYREFSKFVRITPLVLCYQLTERYYVPVRITKLEKGELMNGGAGLNCEVSFITTGLYYKQVSKKSDTLSLGGKVYDYVYPYTYAEVSKNTVLIESDSYEDSPCKLSISGPCINPVWKHYVNNELYETGAYQGAISEDHKLVIDTTTIPYSITERGVNNSLVADRYQMCDFSTERFFYLQHGANRISVSHDGLNTVNVVVEGKISYETV